MSGVNGIKIPGWMLGSLLSLLLGGFGFWGVWSVAKADVNNLKNDVEKLKPLITAVAVINNEMPNLSKRVDQVQIDVREIKDTQDEMQKSQTQFQVEIQRDIKVLLTQRNR